tara:strand:- start:711 stop:923 length:213 start_codon:yes stop_codon:yes gene_type:complete
VNAATPTIRWLCVIRFYEKRLSIRQATILHTCHLSQKSDQMLQKHFVLANRIGNCDKGLIETQLRTTKND